MPAHDASRHPQEARVTAAPARGLWTPYDSES